MKKFPILLMFLTLSTLQTVLGQQSRSINSIDFAIENLGTKDFLLLDSTWLHFDPALFPLSETRFFYINYQHQGESINKRLPIEGEYVLILQNELFLVDDASIPAGETTDHQLYYHDTERQSSEKITSLSFVIAENQQFVMEVYELINKPGFANKSNTEIIKALANLWQYKYGFIDNRSLQSLLYQAQQFQPKSK